MRIKFIVLLCIVAAGLAKDEPRANKQKDKEKRNIQYSISHHYNSPYNYRYERRISTGSHQLPYQSFYPGPRPYSPYHKGRPRSLPPPPYAVQMEPLVQYSQRDPLYDTNVLSLNTDGHDDLLTDTNHLSENVYAAAYPPHKQIIERPIYIKEPEPIIEIIIKESNITLPPPPPPPSPPPKKKEEVQVFYVKYKKNPNGHGKDSVIYDKPVPAISPPVQDEVEEEPPQTYHHHEVATAPPPPSTTLRTIIRPDSETYHSPSGIKVTFGKEGFDHDKRSSKFEDSNRQPPRTVQFPESRQLSFPPRPRILNNFPPQSSSPPRFPTQYRPIHFRQPPPSFGRQVSPSHYSTLPRFPQFVPQEPPKFASAPSRPAPPQFHQSQPPRQPVPYKPFDSFRNEPPRQPSPQIQFRPQTHFPVTQQLPLTQSFTQFAQPPQSSRPSPSLNQPFAHQFSQQNQQFNHQSNPVNPSQVQFVPNPPPPNQNRFNQHQFNQELPQHQQHHFNQPPNRQEFKYSQDVPAHPQQNQQQHFRQELPQTQPNQQHFNQPPQQQFRQELPQPHQQQQFDQQNQHLNNLQLAQNIPPGGELIAALPKFEQHISSIEPSQGLQIQPSQGLEVQSSQNAQSEYNRIIQQHFSQGRAPQPQFFSTPSPTPKSTPTPRTTTTPTTTTTTTTTPKPSTTTKDPKILNAQLPDEVPEDLRQQLLSSGILNNADISILDYDKVGDIPLSALPPDQLANFYNAGGAQQLSSAGASSEPIPKVVDKDGKEIDMSASEIQEVREKPPVAMKVVRYDPLTEQGQKVQDDYIKEDATRVEPVDLDNEKYNRYLPLKVSGTQFPIPDVPELKGKKISSVVVLAPIAYDFSSQRKTREAKNDEIAFLEGDLKQLLTDPSKKNFERFLESQNRTRSDQQSVILLVTGDATKKEIFMYDVATKTVSKLDGELSSAFVDAAEANSFETKEEGLSTSNIIETRLPFDGKTRRSDTSYDDELESSASDFVESRVPIIDPTNLDDLEADGSEQLEQFVDVSGMPVYIHDLTAAASGSDSQVLISAGYSKTGLP